MQIHPASVLDKESRILESEAKSWYRQLVGLFLGRETSVVSVAFSISETNTRVTYSGKERSTAHWGDCEKGPARARAVEVEFDGFGAQHVPGVHLSCVSLTKQMQTQDQTTT